MKVGLITLVSVAACAAAPTSPARGTATTTKSVEQFGGCFIAAQDSASLAWSFVPRSNGGTFSNLGARGAHEIYFLTVSDRGVRRELSLETAAPKTAADVHVTLEMNRCA